MGYILYYSRINNGIPKVVVGGQVVAASDFTSRNNIVGSRVNPTDLKRMRVMITKIYQSYVVIYVC